MKTIIHVNQHAIRANQANGTRKPVITVKRGRKNEYCYAVEIKGPASVIYPIEKTLSCGARVWIETESPVKLRKRLAKRRGPVLACAWNGDAKPSGAGKRNRA